MVRLHNKSQNYQSLHPDAVPAFKRWAESSHIAKQLDLKFLTGCTIGVDAIQYLRSLPQEALLSALGGAPLALEATVIRAIKDLQKAGLTLHFIFNGLDSGVEENVAESSARAAQLSNEAFNLYEGKQPADAERTFGISGLSAPQFDFRPLNSALAGISATMVVTEILKKTLHENNIAFTVAPYSALAQVGMTMLQYSPV